MGGKYGKGARELLKLDDWVDKDMDTMTAMVMAMDDMVYAS